MDCEQAQQLFDAYLDGDLSPAMRTELGAHQLQCEDCRRALALLEVSGHIVAADPHETTGLDDGFVDRLLEACHESPQNQPFQRIRRFIFVGSGLAAAAVVGLALIGVFDSRGNGKVAGVTATNPIAQPTASEIANSLDEFDPRPEEGDGMDAKTQALDEFLRRTRDNIDVVEDALDLTILQTLDILEEAKNSPTSPRSVPALQDPAQVHSPDEVDAKSKNQSD